MAGRQVARVQELLLSASDSGMSRMRQDTFKDRAPPPRKGLPLLRRLHSLCSLLSLSFGAIVSKSAVDRH